MNFGRSGSITGRHPALNGRPNLQDSMRMITGSSFRGCCVKMLSSHAPIVLDVINSCQG